MIIGMGADMTDIRRVQETLERFGDRYIQRCFTAIEQQKSEGRAQRAVTQQRRAHALVLINLARHCPHDTHPPAPLPLQGATTTCSPTWTWGWAQGRLGVAALTSGARMQVGAARRHACSSL